MRASRFTRVLRTLTALVTVWCLGCNAFDPLISSLLPGDGPMMLCASDEAGMVRTAAADQMVVSAVAAVHGPTDGASCGCASCSAPSPVDYVAALPDRSQPAQLAADPVEPASVARTPLVPPPQRVA